MDERVVAVDSSTLQQLLMLQSMMGGKGAAAPRKELTLREQFSELIQYELDRPDEDIYALLAHLAVFQHEQKVDSRMLPREYLTLFAHENGRAPVKTKSKMCSCGSKHYLHDEMYDCIITTGTGGPSALHLIGLNDDDDPRIVARKFFHGQGQEPGSESELHLREQISRVNGQFPSMDPDYHAVSIPTPERSLRHSGGDLPDIVAVTLSQGNCDKKPASGRSGESSSSASELHDSLVKGARTSAAPSSARAAVSKKDDSKKSGGNSSSSSAGQPSTGPAEVTQPSSGEMLTEEEREAKHRAQLDEYRLMQQQKAKRAAEEAQKAEKEKREQQRQMAEEKAHQMLTSLMGAERAARSKAVHNEVVEALMERPDEMDLAQKQWERMMRPAGQWQRMMTPPDDDPVCTLILSNGKVHDVKLKMQMKVRKLYDFVNTTQGPLESQSYRLFLKKRTGRFALTVVSDTIEEAGIRHGDIIEQVHLT